MKKSHMSIIWLILLGVIPVFAGGVFLALKSRPTMDSSMSMKEIVTNVPPPSATPISPSPIATVNDEVLLSSPTPEESVEIPVDYMAALRATEPPPPIENYNPNQKEIDLEIRKFEEEAKRQRFSQWMTAIGAMNTMAMAWVTLIFKRREKDDDDE